MINDKVDQVMKDTEAMSKLLGGWYIIIRRFAIPIVLISIGLILWSMELPTILIFVILGFSLGPVVYGELRIVHWVIARKKNKNNE